MRKRRLVWIPLLAVLAAVAAGAWLRPSREPSYEGRKLSQWLAIAGNPEEKADSTTKAEYAIREMGTNAIPWLLNELEVKDSWLKRIRRFASGQKVIRISIRTEDDRTEDAWTGFRVLGPQARTAIPELTKRLHQPDSAGVAALTLLSIIQNVPKNDDLGGALDSRRDLDALDAMRRDVLAAGLRAFTNQDYNVRAAGVQLLGDGAVEPASAVPALIQALSDPDIRVRVYAVHGLGRKTSQPVAAIPPLIAALSDSNWVVRRQAAASLGSYYRQAKTAVPALLKARSDPDAMVREAVKVALDKIDPETAAMIPDLPDFKPMPPASVESPSP